MRAIKFRAWVKSEHSGDYHMVDVVWVNFSEHLILGHNGLQYTDYKLMQYTGLKDKHGLAIYEGDIVKYSCPELEEDIGITEIGSVVTFENGVYLLKEIGYTGGDETFLYDFSKVVEVIGNIHENPELVVADNA